MKGNALLSGNVFCGHCGARLHLSTANKCYTKADGAKVRKPRVRYVCYGKTRKITPCEGQSAYIQHDEIISWSSLYDSAPIEAKKMIVNSMIKRVDVYRNYELNVELNMNIR